jgi:hypothetical protein
MPCGLPGTTRENKIRKPRLIGADHMKMFHGNVNTECFADGHAEAHTWRNPNLVKYGKEASTGSYVSSWSLPGADINSSLGILYTDSDFSFVYEHYLMPKHQ